MGTELSPLNWESKHVATFLSSLGFRSLESSIIDNGITGEILLHADHDLLKELNVFSVGVRINILKAVYALKLRFNIPIEDYDYIPKSIRLEMEKDMIINETKYKIMDNKYKENEQQVYKLVSDVKQINEEIKQFKEDIKTIKVLMNSNVNIPELNKVNSSSNINLHALVNESENSKKAETIKVYSALEKQECETLYKSLKLTSDDTTQTFLAEVLKKYQIKDDISLYRLSINSDRYLENDEHPLEILLNFKSKGTVAELFLRKINLKEEQRAKLNSMDLKVMPQINAIKESTEKAVVLLPYKKKKDNEVSVEVGEIVEILNRESIEKFRVQKKGGIIGFLPAECIVEKSEDEEMELYDEPQEGEIKKEYKKNNAFEISLKKGDKVKIYAKFRAWMYVDSNKKQGWMPLNNIILNPLSQSMSMQDINKFDDKNEDNDQKYIVNFGSNSSLLNSQKMNSTNYINEIENNEDTFIMEGANEKEKNMLGSYLLNSSLDDIPNTSISKLQNRKLPQIPQSSSLENLYMSTSPKRDKNNLTLIRTNMHMRSASTNDSLPSTNSMLYAKFHLPTHSRKNSADCVTPLQEKENIINNLHTPLSALTNNYNSPPSSTASKNSPTNNEVDPNNKNARSKINDLISNFPHEGEEDTSKKSGAIPNKVSSLAKQFQVIY